MTPPLEAGAFRQGEAGAETRKGTGEQKAGNEEQASQEERLAPWHPVPIRLVDMVMPHLRDTELRVLLVVLRQTWGWKVDRMNAGKTEAGKTAAGQHTHTHKQLTKRRDWLSHRQLCRRTGRGSDAVSAAVASLTASGLVIVEDAGGKPLITPEERRRCLGRLYFRPGTMWKTGTVWKSG